MKDRIVHDFSAGWDDWPPEDDFAERYESEAARLARINAVIRRLEAQPGSLGRIAPEPKLPSRWVLLTPAACLLLWAAVIWWQWDNIGALLARWLT